jgi:hypothetical protein
MKITSKKTTAFRISKSTISNLWIIRDQQTRGRLVNFKGESTEAPDFCTVCTDDATKAASCQSNCESICVCETLAYSCPKNNDDPACA